jgi:class 3 adenylate cyclase
VPADARFCPSCASPITQPAAPSEERKLATVLFADLVGSTELAGSQDPERTRALLNRFYDAMAAEIEGAGGTIEKFVGDAVMAAFGAPAAQEDHAERALHAALSMQRRLEELFGDALSLRIGVNTGDVVVGQPREGSSFVTGDPVNVAARLEQAAEPGEILVGERTAAAVGGAFELGGQKTVAAKGKGGGGVCRRVIRALSLMRPRGVGGLSHSFVGRERELDALQDAYRRAVEEREPRLVTVIGDAGIGKTTLIREFWEWLGAQAPATRRRTGRCQSYGSGTGYMPLGEIVREHFGLLESDAPERVRQLLGSRAILGLTLGLEAPDGLHPLAARDRLQEEWIAFLGELVAEQPAVILIEDLHWADEALLELLEEGLHDVRGALLTLATARLELLHARPAWGGRPRGRDAETLWLEALTEADSARMLEELIPAALPPPVRAVVIDRAAGNPFFVEELVRTLIDQKVLERRNGSWAVGRLPEDFAVPDNVKAVLAARIDLLPTADKAGLQAAAVIGRTFWAGPVYELLEGLEPDLRLLEGRDFIRHRSGSSLAGEREFVIKHALTREVAYGGLSTAKRARLHARFADWLERLGEARDEHAAMLAHHYAEAARPDDVDLAWPGEEAELARLRVLAVTWLRRAAELAVGRSDIDEALGLLRRALELEADDVDLWWATARAHALKFDGEAYWDAMLRAIGAADDRQTLAELYGDLALESTLRGGMWKRLPDDELVNGWGKRALELAEPESRAEAKAELVRANRTDDIEAADHAIAIAERLDDVELLSYGYGTRAGIAYVTSEYDEALAWDHRTRALAGRITDPDHLALNAYFSSVFELGLGRFDEARAQARRQQDIAAALSAHHAVHAVASELFVEELSGRWEAIRKLQLRVERSVRANVTTPCVLNASLLLSCAAACAELGHTDEASRLERAEEDLGMERYQLFLDPLRARLALIRGDLAQVQGLLEKLDLWHWVTHGHLVGVTTRLDVLVALGRADAVEESAPQLLQPGTYVEPFALRALGRVRGDPALVDQAIERFEALGLEWHAAQTRGARA